MMVNIIKAVFPMKKSKKLRIKRIRKLCENFRLYLDNNFWLSLQNSELCHCATRVHVSLITNVFLINWLRSTNFLPSWKIYPRNKY